MFSHHADFKVRSLPQKTVTFDPIKRFKHIFAAFSLLNLLCGRMLFNPLQTGGSESMY